MNTEKILRKSAVKKKAVRKPRKKKVIEETPKRLTDVEVIKMELNGQLLININTRIENEKLKKELLLKEIKEQDVKISNLLYNRDTTVGKHKLFVTEIKERLQITNEKWGYDPETGEIND